LQSTRQLQRFHGKDMSMKPLIRLFATLLISLMTGLAPAMAEYVAPFSLMDPAQVKPRKTECAKAPEPVINLDLVSKYGDDGPERDDVDETAERAFDEAMLPLRDYTAQVVRQANRFTDKGRSGDGDCAISLLKAWAEAGALANPKSNTALFKLGTTLSALSAAWLQVREAANPDDRATIDQWLSARATLLRILFEGRKGKSAKTGNHRAWAGLGVAMTGIAAGRADLFDWGLQSYEMVLCSANPDGSLPTELARGKKARDYHLFALAPLVMLAEIGLTNNRPADKACDQALKRVVDFTFASVADPTEIALLAEMDQIPFPDGANLPPANRLAFMEAYLKRFPEAVPQASAILALRPLRATDLGGDMTLLFRTR
jgi:poly(beta-D-mannuronate) lyase